MRLRLKHDRLARELARRGRRRGQNAWALALGLDSGHLSKLVNGHRPYPGAATRQKLLDGLGLEVEELFEVEYGVSRSRSAARSRTSRRKPMVFWNDLRFALRASSRRPGFSLLVLLVLALGLGSTSAVFGLVEAVLIDPLPFPDPERLVLLWSEDREDGGRDSFSFPDYRDVRDSAATLESVAAFSDENFVLGDTAGAEAERVAGELVTEAYFRLLGVEAALGRVFADDGETPVAVLSDALFRRRFGADSTIVGEPIDINGSRFQVVGVMPPRFRGFSGGAEIFVPMTLFDVINPDLRQYDILNNRGTRWHSVIARVGDAEAHAPGGGLGGVRAELAALAAALEEEHPRANEGRGIAVVPAYDELVGEYRSSLLLLLAAVGFLLLLACANIANLFLTRVLDRRSEIGIRVALGASRARLARQLLTETTFFSVVGGALGVALGHLALRLFVDLAPVPLPSYVEPGLSPSVLGCTFLLAVLTGIAFGVLPAALQVPSARPASGRLRAQSTLAFAEIALATLLLVGALLMVKSFSRMQLFDPGFDTRGLLTMRFHVPGASAARLDQIAEAASRAPGVEASALASHVYFGGGYMSGDFFVEGREEELETYRHYVGPGYFRSMGLPVLRGRAFDERDGPDGAPVVIVNESFAAAMWPEEGGDGPAEAIGRRVSVGRHDADEPWALVVGVVPDVTPRLRLTTANRLPQVYIPIHQGGDWGRALVLRTSEALAHEPAAAGPSVVRALQAYDPGIAVYGVASMDDLLARSRETARAVGYLMSTFAALALVLAAFGLYAVVSYSVGRSRRELGIRVALGALRADVLSLVLRRAAITGVSGLFVGLAGAAVLTRGLASFLYEVQPLDAATFAVAGGGMLLVVVAASLAPAFRAARVDPVITLRQD